MCHVADMFFFRIRTRQPPSSLSSPSSNGTHLHVQRKRRSVHLEKKGTRRNEKKREAHSGTHPFIHSSLPLFFHLSPHNHSFPSLLLFSNLIPTTHRTPKLKQPHKSHHTDHILTTHNMEGKKVHLREPRLSEYVLTLHTFVLTPCRLNLSHHSRLDSLSTDAEAVEKEAKHGTRQATFIAAIDT